MLFAVSGNNKYSEFVCDYVFPTYQWCHVAVVHGQGGQLGTGTVRLYVNGQHVATGKLRCVEMGVVGWLPMLRCRWGVV